MSVSYACPVSVDHNQGELDCKGDARHPSSRSRALAHNDSGCFRLFSLVHLYVTLLLRILMLSLKM